MNKEIITFGKFSEMAKKTKVPLSPAIKANGFVFVSGMPPIDHDTGKFVNGDIRHSDLRGQAVEKTLLPYQVNA